MTAKRSTVTAVKAPLSFVDMAPPTAIPVINSHDHHLSENGLKKKREESSNVVDGKGHMTFRILKDWK